MRAKFTKCGARFQRHVWSESLSAAYRDSDGVLSLRPPSRRLFARALSSATYKFFHVNFLNFSGLGIENDAPRTENKIMSFQFLV